METKDFFGKKAGKDHWFRTVRSLTSRSIPLVRQSQAAVRELAAMNLPVGTPEEKVRESAAAVGPLA